VIEVRFAGDSGGGCFSGSRFGLRLEGADAGAAPIVSSLEIDPRMKIQ
jgi:hypothetical protein